MTCGGLETANFRNTQNIIECTNFLLTEKPTISYIRC